MFKELLESKRPILIYSEYCQYSNQFLKQLKPHKELFELFYKLKIDVDSITKQRPTEFFLLQKELSEKITKVPMVIVIEDNALLMLSDKNAFKWLEYHTTSNKKHDKFSGFIKDEMNSFSDNYSKLNSDLFDASEQNYTFSQSKDYTGNFILKSDSLAPGSTTDKKQQPASKQSEYDKLVNSRQPNTNNKTAAINFTDPNFGAAGKLKFDGNLRSKKTAEIEQRLKQLELERE
jgi:hypothetical protein